MPSLDKTDTATGIHRYKAEQSFIRSESISTHGEPLVTRTYKDQNEESVTAKSEMSKYPDYLSPNTTPTKLSKSAKSRARREPSGVFSLFQAPQIQQFKEAFQLIDHDKDGWVNESDLKEIFASLGKFRG